MSGHLIITIPECVIEGGFASKYICYRIQTAPLGLSVRRKFSDFEWLRALLKKRYVGMFIAPMPPKLISPPTSSVAAYRRKIFSCFLRFIGTHDILRFDAAVLAFLGERDNVAWAKYMKDTTHEGGYSWLASAIEAVPRDPKIVERSIAEHKTLLVLHEKHLTKLATTVQALAAASKQMNKAVIKCAAIANEYSKTDVVGKANANFKEPMAHLGNVMSIWGDKSALEPAILTDIMMTCIDYELMSVSSFKHLLAARDNAIIDYEKCQKKVNDHTEAKNNGKTESKGSRFSFTSSKKPIEDAISAAKSELEAQIEIVKAHTGALFLSEFKKFEGERASQLQLIVAMVGAGMSKAQGDVAHAWENTNMKSDDLNVRIRKIIPDFEDYNNKHGNEEETEEVDDGTD
jgi:hypothetical protein